MQTAANQEMELYDLTDGFSVAALKVKLIWALQNLQNGRQLMMTQPANLPSLISLCCLHEEALGTWLEHQANTKRSVWPSSTESLFGAHAIL